MSLPLRPGRSAAAILSAVALLIALSIAFSFVSERGFVFYLLSIPGQWLTAGLLWTAWWVPAYFLLLAWIALDDARTTWANIVFINAATVPVLTLALLLQLAQGNVASPLVAALSASFTTRASILVVSLLLALEALVLLQLPNLFSSRRKTNRVEALPPPVTDDHETDGPDWVAEPSPVQMSGEEERSVVSHREIGDVPPEEDAPSFEEEFEEEFEDDEVEHQFESLPPEDDDVVRIHFKRGGDQVRRGGLFETAADDEAPVEDAPVEALDDEVLRDALSDDGAPYDELEDELDEGVPRPRRPVRNYQIPVTGILDDYDNARYWEIDEVTERSAEQLKGILDQFGIEAEVTGIRKGPVITMFEILPAPGIKLTRITNLADNIAMGLAASSVRIVAPIPGKHAVGIEIPNRRRNTVSLAEMMDTVRYEAENYNIPVALGKDIPGEAQVIDLTRTPHLLIAGATGSGKSVCVNSIICSILFQRTPLDVRLILIDPKIVELKHYNDIPHLLTPVITDPKRAFQALQWLLYEMERRYAVLDSMSVRDVKSYNVQIRRKRMATEPLPYIVVVIDEFADLMATSGKELESTVARLAAMSRAVGIHLILATQRPSTDVITGLIKANIPSRIAFAVAQKVDSRIILDSMGADKLLGQGDMLFTSSWDPFPVRLQGAYVSDDEVERLVAEVKRYGEPEYIDDEIFFEDEEEIDFDADENDPLMEQAIEIVLSARKASASYLQRRLKVGYNRAARMVEEMERIGIVGPQNGSKPREVIGSP